MTLFLIMRRIGFWIAGYCVKCIRPNFMCDCGMWDGVERRGRKGSECCE